MQMNYFALGQLKGKQARVLTPFIKGKVVHDLGAGMLGMAYKLVELGAAHVVAVDQDYKDKHTNHLNNCQPWKSGSSKISLHASTFEEFEKKNSKPIKTALLSWPWASTFAGHSGDEALVRLLRTATTVIYLGKNFDGTFCGSNTLFNDLVQRKVAAHVPDKWNSLIVYKTHIKRAREQLPEERAVYTNEVLWYEDFYSRDGRPLARTG